MAAELEECMNGALNPLDVSTAVRRGFPAAQAPQPLARLVCHRVPRLAPRLVRRRHDDLGRMAGAIRLRG
ncbi:hypothetical protein SAMN05216268_11233 [Streptomyces yunnanensis]|uniref:Uncharacterized protein n=1 Tax=Streptomyces yunnanensis TaxID=156453 RepID=A0A9X8QW24_9ACTN|nr:hypothetical protein SAMN05216268_11233 [Streptomyces yunnanensis]